MSLKDIQEQGKHYSILFVDDETSILSSLTRVMRDFKFQCRFANSGEQALQMMEESPADIIISDMKMPAMNGAQLLEIIAEKYPLTVRLILSGYSDTDSILDAINKGRIWGYINKPWDNKQLIQTIEHAIQMQELIAEKSLLERTVKSYQTSHKEKFQEFIGTSMSMQFVYAAIELAAPSNASVVITGSTGTGKELAANAIHQLSQRKNKPMIALNCAAIPGELMESEIFGHIKGAFSGAINNRDGAATLADGGTLFLDELTEMDINLQAKLLRFIQTGTFQKVGSGKLEKVDIRFVCATNRDPLKAIAEKKLREDLFYRLNVIPINLPDLKDRENDSYIIALSFLQKYTARENKNILGFSKSAEEAIKRYDWPGNVRQLENCIYNAVIMSRSSLINDTDLQIPMSSSSEISASQTENRQIDTIQQVSSNLPILEPTNSNGFSNNSLDKTNLIIPLLEVEKRAIKTAIDLCDQNVVKAASMLDVSPSTLYRKIQSWEEPGN